MTAERLKIAMLSVHSCPLGELGTRDTGGMSVYVRELARELGARGHQVDVYTRRHGTREPEVVQLGQGARLIHLQAGQDVRLDKLAIYPHLADFAAALEDYRSRNGLSYDLIHGHYWLSGWVGRWLRARWGAPLVMMFHTLAAVKNAIGVGRPEPELRLAAERELVRDCQRLIAPTEREKGELVGFYDACPGAIGVVPCGVNLDLFRPRPRDLARQRTGLDQAGRLILYVGRIDPLKGLDRLLTALAGLPERQGLRLVVAGGDDGPEAELERLQGLAGRLGLRDRVVFLGRVRHESLPLYYSAADFLVLPSYHESFGLVALESLACGRPVVASRVGGLETVIRQGQNGWLVAGEGPDAWTEGLAAFLARPSLEPEAVPLIRASVSRFSWSNVAEAIVEEYRTALRLTVAQAA